jgi:hypothetical protein
MHFSFITKVFINHFIALTMTSSKSLQASNKIFNVNKDKLVNIGQGDGDTK